MGPKPLPSFANEYWERWRELMPDWILVDWTQLPKLVNQQAYDDATSYAQKSDIARYELLYYYGGVYVDTDVEPVKSIESLVQEADAFAGYEDDTYLCNAVLGANAGHPLMGELILGISDNIAATKDRPINEQTGPVYLTKVAQGYQGLVRFEPVVFYPYSHTSGDAMRFVSAEDISRTLDGGCYAIHRWEGDW